MEGGEPSDTGYRVRLFIRGTVPPEIREQQEETVNRLEELDSEHDLPLEVTAWPRSIDVDPVGMTETYLDLLETFRAWAHAQGCTLTPAVDTKRADSWLSAEQRLSVSLPVMLLAVYEGDEIAAVYPHVDGDEVRTVPQGIEALTEVCAEETGPDKGEIAVAD